MYHLGISSREKIKSLTGIDIMTDDSHDKPIAQVIYELSRVYRDLSRMEQISVADVIAGKQNSIEVMLILSSLSKSHVKPMGYSLELMPDAIQMLEM